jgi:hypothetical protein
MFQTIFPSFVEQTFLYEIFYLEFNTKSKSWRYSLRLFPGYQLEIHSEKPGTATQIDLIY